MTKADIVDRIAKGTGLTRKETSAVVDGLLSTVTFALQSGERIELRGFGTFCLRHRKKKTVNNPKTGKVMHIPDRTVPDFKPSPQLKAAVSKGFQERDGSADFPQSQTDIFTELERYHLQE
jgi:DNA-binding protein HU-beta